MIGGGSVNYLRFLITGDSSSLQAEVEKSKRTVTGLIDEIGSRLGRLGPIIGGVFAGVTVTGFIGKLVSVQREFDVLNSSLVTVTGSARAAGREMEWLKAFAKDTPYGLAQATQGFVKMKALGLDPTQSKLTSFGNTAAAMGKDLMQMIEAVADASTGEFERLKEFGIKASKQGDQVAFTFQGVTTRVKDSARDITAYLENIGNTNFAGAMEERAKTLDGAIAGLGDSWDEFFRTVNASTGFSDAAAAGVRRVTDAIDGLGRMVENHKVVVMGLVGALGGAAAVAGLMAVTKAIGAVSLAVGGLAAILLANPATAALLGVGVVVGAGLAAVSAYAKTADGIAGAIESLRAENERSEAAMARATAGGRTAGADNIAKTIEARKDQIAKLRAELDMLNASSKGAGGGRGSVNPPTAGEAAAQRAQEDANAEQQLLEIRQKLYGVNKDYLPQLQKLQELRQAGRISEAMYVDMVSKLAKENYKEDESTKARAASAKKLHTEYAGLLESLNEKIAAQKLELSSGVKLSEADKLRIKYQQDLQGSLKGLSAAERAAVEAKLTALKLAERENEARKESARFAEEERKRRLDLASAAEQTVTALLEGNKGLREEIELIGVSQSRQEQILKARQEAVLLVKEQQLAEMQRASAVTGFMSREHIALEQEIELLRERLALTNQRQSRTTSANAAAASVTEWQRGVEQIGQSLSDQLMAGGRGFGDYLKNLGRTLVFRPIIQAVVQATLGSVAGGLLGGTSNGGSGSGSGGLDLLATSKGLIGTNTTTGLAGSFNAGMAGGWAGFEGGISMMQNGSMLAGGAQALGAAAPYIGGILQMANGKYGSGVGTMAGAYIGSIVPGIGTAIGAVVGSLLGGLLDGDARGANHSGAAASSLGTGNTAAAQRLMGDSRGDWYTDLTERHNAGLETTLSGTVNALAGVYQQLSGYAGKAARQIELVGGFAANSKYGDEGAVGYGQLWDRVSGQYLGGFSNRDLGTDADAAWTSFVGQMGGLIVAELKASDIPGWMRAQLEGIGDDVTVDGLNKALAAISAIDVAFRGWADTLTGFANLSAEAQTSLINVSGGIEGLAGNIDAFYGGFYSEQERMAILQRQVLEQLSGLGVTVDTSTAQAAKESFRATVEAVLDAGNAELAGKLLALSGNFATVADYAAQSAGQVVTAAQDSSAAVVGLARTLRTSLVELEQRFTGGGFSRQYKASDLAGEVQGLFASVGIQKDVGDLAQQILGATTGDVEEYFRSMWSMLDTDEARAKLVEVTGSLLDMAEASEATAQAVVAERQGLEQQWLQAIGDTSALRERELQALDPSNRALQEMIWGLEDAKTGMSELATNATDAAQKAAQAWQGWGAAAGLAATHLGDTSGLEARRAVLNAQISSSTEPADRLSKLQELISVEQSIAQAQQEGRRLELDAIKTRQQALQKEIASAQQLLSAAQALGSYVQSLRTSEASGLSGAQRLTALGGEYSALLGKAQGGDAEALARLQSVSSDYIGLSREMAASGADYSALVGRVSAELESVSLAQQQVAQTGITAREAEIAQLTQQNEYLSAGVELSDETKRLIQKSMVEQQDAWGREASRADVLAELQQRATDSLAVMPDGIARALNPIVSGAASYIAGSVGNSVSGAIGALASMLGLESVPAFASGGWHLGGMRLVGERGPELEVTGAARYWNASQTQAMLGGGGDNGRLEALLERLLGDNRVNAGGIVRPLMRIARQLEQWDVDGAPPERDEKAITK